ncbi:MAG: hypothetical protein J6B32_03890 [Spirochaetaceae bacterium]|nr:hypothetical protein [Spirochaetaceae bacterium]
MKPTLLVLAAGMGSRYGGVKQIDGVGLHEETLLDFATFDAMKSGFGKVIYIIRKDIEKDFRERFFDRVAKNFNAEYIFQTPQSLLTDEQFAQVTKRTKPWGTLHAVLCAESIINEPFAVINADDYYGRSAFETLSNHLSNIDANSNEHAMVGFVLQNTMSPSGTVTRAVCQVQDGYLVSMKENSNIGYDGDKIFSVLDGNKIQLTGKEWVSMNFFGFSPTVFQDFSAYWRNFVSKSLTSEKDEALLPEAASQIVSKGHGKIKVYTTEEMWFGMTYPQDRPMVKAEISKKINSGYYPEELWKN